MKLHRVLRIASYILEKHHIRLLKDFTKLQIDNWVNKTKEHCM
jgi:hypothetical protein